MSSFMNVMCLSDCCVGNSRNSGTEWNIRTWNSFPWLCAHVAHAYIACICAISRKYISRTFWKCQCVFTSLPTENSPELSTYYFTSQLIRRRWLKFCLWTVFHVLPGRFMLQIWICFTMLLTAWLHCIASCYNCGICAPKTKTGILALFKIYLMPYYENPEKRKWSNS